MKKRYLFTLVLIILLAATGLVFTQDYICRHNAKLIQSILASDKSFQNVQLNRLGTQLSLHGSVMSNDDLKKLLAALKQVKRGRVVSWVVVDTNTPALK